MSVVKGPWAEPAPKKRAAEIGLSVLAGGVRPALDAARERKHVDPSLDIALAGRMEALAENVRMVMRYAQTARRFRDAVWLMEMADALETRSVEIEAEHAKG